MTWSADVPFPNEKTGTCRGCGAKIGWVRRGTPDGEKPHPVEMKGWAGLERFEQAPGGKVGYTREGDFARVVEPPPGTPARGLTVVFESHFALCSKADRFRAAARHRTRETS